MNKKSQTDNVRGEILLWGKNFYVAILPPWGKFYYIVVFPGGNTTMGGINRI